MWADNRLGLRTGAVALVSLAAACSPRQEGSELEWARAALERNPRIEVVATDPAEGVFTIRLTDTGEVQVVSLADLAAAPVAQLDAIAVANPAPDPDTDGAPQAATDIPAAPAPSPAQPEPERQAPQPPASSAAADATQSPPAAPSYTIERSGNQVRVSGPGVSIVSAGAGSAAAPTNAQTQRSAEPIICEGRRLLHIDGRDIFVEGNAVVARGGCELHITNSRIAATGTGVEVQDAVVHISNSHVGGETAAFSAGERAKVFLRSSTFRGLPRRADGASIQDQGGNQWR